MPGTDLVTFSIEHFLSLPILPSPDGFRERTNAWQILDQPGREGNYIESSGSAMFVYALLKGLRLGYLSNHVEISVNATGIAQDSRSSLTKLATRAYSYIVQNFVVNNGNGTLGYNGTVSVCSLNSTASYDVS